MSHVRSLLHPRSIAIVGASPRHAAMMRTTLRSGVQTWAVNPNRDEVLGVPCHPSVAALPETPELAFLLVNHERVEAALAEALDAGVRAFVVPGVGAEAGAAAKEVVSRLATQARGAGAAMVGPNCMGVFVPGGPAAWAGAPLDTTAPGHVAVLCQSGSVADAFLSLGGRIGLRCVVSSGAEAVTDAADFLAYFAEDEDTRAVGLFLETVRRPQAFIDALARCTESGKLVVCLKVGRSDAGARIALSHTGAIVGSTLAFSAALSRYGGVEVDDFHELVETLEVLGRRRRPAGTRIGAISESGGECALLADQAEAAGIPFAPLPDELAAQLREEFPNYRSPDNPLDAWGIADELVVYPRSLELMAASGAFDVLLAQIDLSQFRDPSNDQWLELALRTLGRLQEEHDLFAAVTTVHSVDPRQHFQELASELDVPLLRGVHESMRALAHVARWRPPRTWRDDGIAPDVGDLLVADGPLPEHESALVLERFGVPFAPRRRASSPAEAASVAKELGFPVVVKLDGPVHKRRAGGVILGVASPDAAADAAERLGGPALVAKQVEPGDEVLCGMTRDPDYGPVIAVGSGGAGVENLSRVALSVAPLDLAIARSLVEDAGIDDASDVVASTLVALSRLAVAYPQIESVDVNPLILTANGPVAVDALVAIAR